MHDLQPGQIGYRLIKRQITRCHRIKRQTSVIDHPVEGLDLQ